MMKKYKAPSYMGGGGIGTELEFDLQRFAQVENPHQFIMDQDYSVTSNLNADYVFDGTYGPIPDENGFVDLTDYAKNYIADYKTITEIPAKNMEYLNACTPNNMTRTFAGLVKCSTIDVSGIDTSHVSSFSYCFDGSAPDTKSDNSILSKITGIENLDTSSATNMESMFRNCNMLENFIAPDWNTKNLIKTNDMFRGCTNIDTIDISNWNTDKITDMSHMFGGSYSDDKSSCGVKTINIFKLNNIQGRTILLCGTFEETNRLSNIDLSRWDTTNSINMRFCFNVSNLSPKKGIETWNTSNVTNMEYMFSNTKILPYEVQNFDTINVTNMSRMFLAATIQGSILDLSKWNTSKVIDMESMFNSLITDSSGLTLNLSNFDTSNCTKMYGLFGDTYSTNAIINNIQITIDMKSLPNTNSINDSTAYTNIFSVAAPYKNKYFGQPISIKNIVNIYNNKPYLDTNLMCQFENKFTYYAIYYTNSKDENDKLIHDGVKFEGDGVVYKVI